MNRMRAIVIDDSRAMRMILKRIVLKSRPATARRRSTCSPA
jgi:hypothetical protein